MTKLELAEKFSNGFSRTKNTRFLLPIVFDLKNQQKKENLMFKTQPPDDDYVFGRDDEEYDPLGLKDRAAKLKEEAQENLAKEAAEYKRRHARFIPVFDLEKIKTEYDRHKNSGHDEKKRMLADLDAAKKHGGTRNVPKFKSISKKLGGLINQYPNFKDAICQIGQEIALTNEGKPADFCVTPFLLDGVPGVGKTAFSNAIAAVLGVPIIKINAGGLSHPGQITGSARMWGNSSTGDIFNLLANNDSAVAVLLIDEVDKIAISSDHPIVPALLSLLEHDSARTFRDESISLTFDASRLIIIMTSNDQTSIDNALLSRAAICTIEMPDEEQRRMIAIGVHDALKRSTRKQIILDVDSLDELVKSDIDLRELNRAVRSGFSKAIIEGKNVSMPVIKKSRTHKKIGFIS